MRGGYRPRPACGGLSLVELMLALGIGVVLSFGVVQLFLRSGISHLQDQELARLQENGRYALRYLSRELNMAGYFANVLWGERIGQGTHGTDCFDHLLDTRLPLEHYNDLSRRGAPADTAAALPADCLGGRAYVQGSDMLLLRRTLDYPAVLRGAAVAAHDPNALYLRVEGGGARATLQRGAARPGPAVDLWEYVPQILFLRDYARHRGDGIPTLCRLRPGADANRLSPLQCLVEGIEDLQLEFGIDEDGDLRADRFDPQPMPRALSAAVAARVFILVRSVRPVPGYSNRQSYRLGHKLVPAAGDGHYRRVVQTTVLLRNSGAYKS